MDRAMDSACDLSASDVVVPVKVTTPLSRSWLTLTSLSPACFRDWPIVSATSADCVGVLEHPAIAPKANIVNNAPDSIFNFIFLLFNTADLIGCAQLAPRRNGPGRLDGPNVYRPRSLSSNVSRRRQTCLFTNALNTHTCGRR